MSDNQCEENTYCLNTRRDQQFLLKFITNKFNGKQELLYKDFSFYINRNKNHIFKMTPIISNKTLILAIYNQDNTNPCLKMKFFKRTQDALGTYYFNKSRIELIARDLCGIRKGKITESLTGKYITLLADMLNNIFRVKQSVLNDDARLTLCNIPIKLKVLKLLSDGQTWYEKTIGFSLVDTSIYELARNVSQITYEYLYNIMKDNPRNSLDGDIGIVSDDDLFKTVEILGKYNLTTRNTLQEIVKSIFETPGVVECDAGWVYTYVLSLPNRKKVYNDPQYNSYKEYIDLMAKLTTHNESIKYYNQ